ncbi:hypothetical protein SUGI_0559750 [Cryptomeria japonica]|nr:hypothetical protein SUGI_0559750 [Cryptomeria japonica]
MARKTQIKGLNADTHKPTSVKLDTIFEDEQAVSRPKGFKIRLGGRKVFGRRWKIWIPKLKLRRIVSPFKALKSLRDAYVRVMLSLESKGGFMCNTLMLGNQVVHPVVMPGRSIHRHNQEHELRMAALRAPNFIV